MSNCEGHPDCNMTAGYYIGGSMWICWLHALFSKGMMTVINRTGQELRALPRQSGSSVE